jgi:hypothetical protein
MTKRALAVVVIALSACADGPAEDPGTKPDDGPLPAGELQPLEVGRTWTYTGSLGEKQVRAITGRESVGRFDCVVYEIRTGSLVQRLWMRAEGDGLKHYRVQVNEQPFVDLDDAAIHYPLPAKPGTRWEYEVGGLFPVNYSGKIEGVETVAVPAGSYRCLKVRTTGTKDKVTVTERIAWYAPGVGLVKEESTLNRGDGEERGVISLKEMK